MQDDTNINLLLKEIKQLKQQNIELQKQNTNLRLTLLEYQNRKIDLERAEHEKAAILDLVKESIFYMDTDMKILYANKVGGESIGMRPEQMVGRYCYEAYHGRNEPCPDCNIMKVIETNQAQVEERVFPDGILRLSRAYPVRNDARDLLGVFEMGLDITELKKAKEKLQKSQQDVTDILNSISDPFLVLDSQWCYTYVNQVEASLFGKTVEELIGKNYLALFPNLVDSVFYQNYYKAMVEKVPMHFESKGVYLNSWFETHVYPLQNGIIIYARDITEKKLLEQELQQSEERFRTAIENMLDCFGIFKAIRNNSGQIEDFLVEYVNEAACRNDAMTKDEQSGKRLRDVFPNIRVTELFDEYCKVVETGEPLVKDDLKWVNRYQKRGAYDLRSVKLGDGVAVACAM